MYDVGTSMPTQRVGPRVSHINLIALKIQYLFSYYLDSAMLTLIYCHGSAALQLGGPNHDFDGGDIEPWWTIPSDYRFSLDLSSHAEHLAKSRDVSAHNNNTNNNNNVIILLLAP